ncbi:winged helix DNA-binding protein [Sphingomonas sp. PP-CC-3G-468]|nr:winged helix DNA-binding protein [Sphingomonas sp. PP-CC-3G-468]
MTATDIAMTNDAVQPLDRIQSIREELDRLARQIADFGGVRPSADKRRALRTLAKGLLWQRTVIASYLDSSDFVDPATNLMLFIYAGATDGQAGTLSAGACCEAAGVPRTTGLRWIGILEQKGLVKSTTDPKDKRRTTVQITQEGRAVMDRCMTAIDDAPTAGISY